MFETGSHWAPRGRQDRAERTTRQRAKVSVLCLSGPPARTQRPERPSANQVSKYFKVFMTPIPVNNHIEIHAWHRLLMHLGLETLLLLESRPLRKNTRPVILRGSLGGCSFLKVLTPTTEEFPVLSALINGATHGFQYGCLLGWES